MHFYKLVGKLYLILTELESYIVLFKVREVIFWDTKI